MNEDGSSSATVVENGSAAVNTQSSVARPVLNLLGGNVNSSVTSSKPPVLLGDKSSNIAFQIFTDNNAPTVPSGQQPKVVLEESNINPHWKVLGSDSVRRKENDAPVLKWSEAAPLVQAAASRGLGSSLNIYVDEECIDSNKKICDKNSK